MRLSRFLSVVLLGASVVSAAGTLVDQDGWPWPHRPRTTTIVDLLSSSEEFGPLIRALQRTALIPILNASENVTLIAPMSDAINKFDGELTRELLMYHILKGSVLSSMVEDEIVVESILKMDPKDNTSLGIGVKIERQGDRGRGQGLLRIGEVARVVKSDWEANNGVIQVVDKLIHIPKSIDWILRNNPNLTSFNSLYKISAFPSSYSLFVPDNDAFKTLHPIEMAYLETHFGRHDRVNLLNRHACKDVLYINDLKKDGNVSSLEGEKIHYGEDAGDILVDGANVTDSDIVAKNGVVHVLSKLLIPSSVVFTPLKYIYGLHDFIFAETLAASDSFRLANDSSLHQSIFAPIDKAYADSVDAEEVLRQVRYNFIDNSIDLQNVTHNALLETKYTLKSLNGAGQMIKVTRVDGKTFLNNRVEVLGNPVQSGNTTIYEIAGQLSPPGPLRPTSSQGLSLFRSFHHLVFTGLDQRILFDESAITVLLPVDRAWNKLGLTEKYLLSDESGGALRKVMLYGILKGIHYSQNFSSKSKAYTTLNNDKVKIHSDGNYLIFDDLNLKMAMDEHDILSSNGVAHSLSEIPIPSSVIITPENLINATGSSSWQGILEKYNLTRYLDLNENHTLLIPSDEAINKSPLTSLNDDAVRQLINFHIIPPVDGHPPSDLLSDTPVMQKTLAGNSISIHRVYNDVWSIQVNDSTNSARILDQGKTTNGAQILLIDQVLFEPTDVKWSWAKPLAVIIFAVAMTVIVASGVSYGIRFWQRRRESKPLFHSADPAESEPFLNGGA